jgi:hypothetical protein
MPGLSSSSSTSRTVSTGSTTDCFANTPTTECSPQELSGVALGGCGGTAFSLENSSCHIPHDAGPLAPCSCQLLCAVANAPLYDSCTTELTDAGWQLNCLAGCSTGR